ncbi:alpha/beta hydrolase-fold protein [Agromyces sp. H3Y2-19a]|uniref:alpha/beta hydrolase n=1 Tax=Agromyces TaxID=33877 RepID=UPI001E59856E|nr:MULTISPECIES: alpha/beta fold hydrolase [Agromyces]MCD5346182.1 dienelactone hydrolase family protein [Agromyces sp. S2-1-8]MDF0512549.1 alpha/beta hydrolase-fold protein [Agromyces chromiiresistens]
MIIDDEAVLWSAAGEDRADRPLLVLLHGYNSNEGDLFGLAPYLPLQPVIASLRAPLDAGYGYAWFEVFDERGRIDDDSPAKQAESQAAAEAVLAWVDRAAPGTPVGLVGFSQGGALCLELLRLAPERFEFAAILAGFAMPGERDGDARLATVRPPVFWGRGTLDEVIPAASVARTQDWLPGHATVDARIYEGLGHSVSEAELADLTGFLRDRYAA